MRFGCERSPRRFKANPQRLSKQQGRGGSPMIDDRMNQLKAGRTVVASLRMVDGHLVDPVMVYAKQHGLFVRIDRQTDWGNPFPMAKESDRDLVCDRFTSYVQTNPDLMDRIPSLKGKVLGCGCHPRRCHGDFLAELANGDRHD
jgi:hypothetical protein